MRRPAHPPPRTAGFTLIELIMVLVIIGTLAIFVLPRALDLTAWRLRAFADDLQVQTMAMQRLALAQRRPVVATISGTGASFAYASGPVIGSIDCPATASPCIAESAARSITFNAGNTGSATTSTGSALPVTVSHGSSSQSYLIEAETGLFRTAP